MVRVGSGSGGEGGGERLRAREGGLHSSRESCNSIESSPVLDYPLSFSQLLYEAYAKVDVEQDRSNREESCGGELDNELACESLPCFDLWSNEGRS